MQQLLKGKAVVEELRTQLQSLVEGRAGDATLAIVLVGDDPASHYYKNHLVKLSGTIGVQTKVCQLDEGETTANVVKVIKELNEDEAIDGILPMMPLPKQINTDAVCEAISPLKDIDCLTAQNAGLLYLGKSKWGPCTARAVMQTLKYYKIPLQGQNVVIIGRSNVVGKPLIPMMLSENATVTVCHSKTKNLPEIARQADVLVVAIGVTEFLTADMVKEGAVLIDVGINETQNGMVGDISASALENASAYTPVPGGIGTVSSMMVMQTLLCKDKLS